MGRKLQAFRVGDVIPEGARYIRSEQRPTGYTYDKVVEPRTFLSWIGITETVATMHRMETVDIYEVPEPAEEYIV